MIVENPTHFTSANRRVKHTSRIELSQKALQGNINFLKKKVGPHPIISSVVKANAYGHGIYQMVPMLEKCGIRHFSVASAFEAEEVLESKRADSTIMIMGILYDEDLEWAIEQDIEFYVFNYERLDKVKAIAEKLGKQAIVHIEIETGTNRTGMSEGDFKRSISFIKRNREHIRFEGLCTHLGGAESLSTMFKIKPQIERYRGYLRDLKKKDFLPRYRHIACSAAALTMPETVYDMVRIGVATYGFWPSPDTYHLHLQQSGKTKETGLKRIFTWKTDVMDIKKVREGEFIGYGTAFQAIRDMTIAVIPLGYSNGYPRGLSNKGYVLIKGKKAPIVGLVNMNLFMVDISHIQGVEVREGVVLLGKQNNNTIRVSSFTEFTNLLNNEMLSRLPTSIPRVVRA